MNKASESKLWFKNSQNLSSLELSSHLLKFFSVKTRASHAA